MRNGPASPPEPPSGPVIALLGRATFAQTLAIALAAGLLSACGFAPFDLLAAAVLGVGLLLLLLRARPLRQAFPLGLAFGFGQFALSLHWIAQAFAFQSAMPVAFGYVAVVALSLFLALYPAGAAFLARLATARTVPLAVVLAGLFVAGELLRGLLLSGFPWDPLGAAFLALPGVARLAAIFGANGLSALLVLSGGSIAALLAARGEPWRWPLALLFPLLVVLGVAVPRLERPLPAPPGPQLLLVQTGIGIADKYADGGEEKALATTIAATVAALRGAPAPAAIVWPEAAVEFPLEEDAALRRDLAGVLPPGTLLLTGGVSLVRDSGGSVAGATNSLYALDSGGRILARYDKAHLVPFGEYLPLRRLAAPLGLARLVPGTLDFLPGPGARTIGLAGLPSFSPAICYEIVFPGAVVDRRHRPAFLLTVSNDAWFGNWGPPQHFAQARLRAIEEGLPVVRVTPTGLSGLIDARGGIVRLLPDKVAASARVALPAARPPTPFATLGLLAPALFAAALLLAGLWLDRKNT